MPETTPAAACVAHGAVSDESIIANTVTECKRDLSDGSAADPDSLMAARWGAGKPKRNLSNVLPRRLSRRYVVADADASAKFCGEVFSNRCEPHIVSAANSTRK